MQLTTLGMDQRREILVDAIREALLPGNIIERSDAAVRRAEGLQPTSGVLRGEARQYEFEICGVKLLIDPLSAQKTGFYLDQLPHYPAVAGLAAGQTRSRLLYQRGSIRADLCPGRARPM